MKFGITKPHSPRTTLNVVLSVAAGSLVLFLGKLTTWIPAFDAACVRASSATDQQIFELNPESNIISAHTLGKHLEKKHRFQLIAVSDESAQIFEAVPPSPLDYAVILESLRNRGYRNIILTTLMSWDAKPELEAAALSGRLALFQKSVIPLPVTRGASSQPLPAPLRRALIPLSNIKGNYKLIPRVNQVTLPAHAHGGEHTLAGFHRIESTPTPATEIALLAHWEGQGIIPSLELLAVMSAYNINPEELIIECGKHIRLGKQGPVIPLDLYGQTPLPQSTSIRVINPLKVENLVTEKPVPATAAADLPCLIYASGGKTSTSNTLSPSRLTNLINLAENSLTPGKASHYLRLPPWAEIIILLGIALISCWWFASFTPSNRLLAFALLTVSLFPLLFAIMDLGDHWYGLSAPLITLLTAWLIPQKQRP